MTNLSRRDALQRMALLAAGTRVGWRMQGTMITRAIPVSGEKLPVIGMGTWKTFDVSGAAVDKLRPVLERFYALGGRLIDSSPMYGRSEAVTGELTAKLRPREKFFIATKVWTRGEREGIEQMRQSMQS